MPAKDSVHDLVRRLLEEAGWTITHDPLYLKFGERKTYVDIGAEALGAELNNRKIAVEIKGFTGVSIMSELEKAIGQFVIYRGILAVQEPERETYVALPYAAHQSLLDSLEGQSVISSCALKMILFDENKEVIVKWIE